MGKGSTRFSDATRQTEYGDIDVISHKPSKKLKTLTSAGQMDKSTCYTKRLELPKKLFDDWHTVNPVSVPRKLRSVIKKRRKEYVCQSSPSQTNRIHRFKLPLEDGNKKLKVDTDENSKRALSILEKITKEEEEAIAGLLALVEIYPGGNNKTNEINLNNEVSEDLVKKCVQIDVKKDSEDGNKSRKRCSSHVYICQIIVDLQIKEGKKVNSLKEPKMETTLESITNDNVAGINLNEARAVSKTLFQDQARACGLQPFFGNPFYDPSQWSRPVVPEQQMWMNPFIPGAAPCQNWQNGIPPLTGSYVQASLQDVLVSKQQLPFKMQFSHRSSGYEENGGFPPTLKLTL